MSAVDDWAPARVVALHHRALERWRPDALADVETARRNAAAAFYQAGVHGQKSLLLGDILRAFEGRRQSGDPEVAALALLGSPDLVVQAAHHHDIALAFAPDFAEALYNRAVLYRRAAMPEPALDAFQRVMGLAVHPNAQPHAHLRANAAWEAAGIAADLDRATLARALFAEAMAGLDNYGPYHRRLPDHADRMGDVLSAMREYARVMRYSHRYVPEFIQPAFGADAQLPVSHGLPLDPLRATPSTDRTGAPVIYFLHLDVTLGRGSDPAPTAARLADAIEAGDASITACTPHLASSRA